MNDNLYRNLSDAQIMPADIPAAFATLSPEKVMLIRDEVKIGGYISVRNQNNLSEVLIYRRNNFSKEDPSIMCWDGVTSNYEWFDSTEKSVYNIANAEQLAGLVELVSLGYNFSGKTVRLVSNINLNYKENLSPDLMKHSQIVQDLLYKNISNEMK